MLRARADIGTVDICNQIQVSLNRVNEKTSSRHEEAWHVGPFDCSFVDTHYASMHGATLNILVALTVLGYDVICLDRSPVNSFVEVQYARSVQLQVIARSHGERFHQGPRNPLL